jgi:uncharacterized protein
MNQDIIYKLHQKYAEGENQKELLDLVWGHSLIVRDIAIELANNLIKKGIKIDKELVEIGALIHDIGCYDYYKKINSMPYILHGIRGYEILKNEGFSEEIAKIATIHLGVGIVKENIVANNLPLEHKNFIPITLEEELVAYSDNFHSKKGPSFMTFEEAKEKLAGLWSESPIIFERFRKKFGEPVIKANF